MSDTDILALFSIDAESGTLLWVKPPKQHPRMIGKPAGSMRKSGHSEKMYCVVKIGRRAYKRGHIIFLSVHGRFPAPCLDHINGDSTDDRIANLREATLTQNAWNHKHRKRQQSHLPMGVRLSSSGRFQARIAVNKVMNHLGCYDTLAEAHSVYLAKRKEFYGEYA